MFTRRTGPQAEVIGGLASHGYPVHGHERAGSRPGALLHVACLALGAPWHGCGGVSKAPARRSVQVCVLTGMLRGRWFHRGAGEMFMVPSICRWRCAWG